MLNSRSLVAAYLTVALASISTAQVAPSIYCTAHDQERLHAMLGQDPVRIAQAEAADAALEAFTADFQARRQQGSAKGGGYVIPVVFHIIHNNGPENIGNDQVEDAMVVLNNDFNKLNDDWDNVNTNFLAIVADVGITFKLAQLDPNGNCTNGITRTVSPLTNDGTQTMKDLIQWPRNKYLNVWVSASADGAAGYTYTPGAVANWPDGDGIVVLHDYLGSIGTSSPGRSRTLTHEVGHWLNLRHVWGPTNEPGLAANCNETDNVTDTPPTEGWTSCNVNGNTCTAPVDNVENYMEYSYCGKMFTEGQKTRMIAALNSATAQRNQLSSPANLSATGVDGPAILCLADFDADRRTVCVGSPVQFSDLSYNNVVNWQWTFPGATPGTSTDQNPLVTYTAPGTYDVTLVAGDGGGTVSTTRSAYIVVLPAPGTTVPFTEGFEGLTSIPGNDWTVMNMNNDETFELFTTAAYSGTKSTRLRNYTSQATNVDELISGSYDMSGATDVTIGFRYSFAQRNSDNDDKLRIYVSKDCGQTWNMRRQLRGTVDLATSTPTNGQFVPTQQSQWGYNVVDNILSTYHVADFRFKFWFEGDGGNNLYLDDININGQPVSVNDLSIASSGLLVVPDPADDGAELVFTNETEGNLVIDVVDALGRKVAAVHNGRMLPGDQRLALPVSTLNAGMYFVRLSSGSAVQSVRFVVR